MDLVEKGAAGSILVILLVSLLLLVGWCMNAYKLIQCDFEPSYKAEIIRGISLVAFPVAGVVGYLTIED